MKRIKVTQEQYLLILLSNLLTFSIILQGIILSKLVDGWASWFVSMAIAAGLGWLVSTLAARSVFGGKDV
jgi:hypothetical protein